MILAALGRNIICLAQRTPVASRSRLTVLSTTTRSLGSKRNSGGNNNRQRQAKKSNKTTTKRKAPNKPPKAWKDNVEQKREKLVPPALLVPTGSRHAFVARTALDDSIDASMLFANNQTRPPLFSKNEFEYLTPSDLNHEYPKHNIPEVAFLGRSNVGKSSLINALMRKDLCVTSKSPGRTQLPYYYGLFPKTSSQKTPDSALGFVIDLPGYGFAAAPTAKVEDWQSATQDLLLDRRDVLKRVYLLVDTRREGPSELDLIVIRWLEDAEIPFSVVLTKSDRTPLPSIIKQVNELCLRYASEQSTGSVIALSPVVHVTSSREKLGINELLQSIEAEFLGEDDYDDYYDEEDTEYDT